MKQKEHSTPENTPSSQEMQESGELQWSLWIKNLELPSNPKVKKICGLKTQEKINQYII